MLSPVRADSSAISSWLSRRRPSAGSLSPVSTQRISPSTTSLLGIRQTLPSRITLTGISSPIRLRVSKAFALLPSITTVITTDREIATKIPMHSRKSASPPVTYRATLTPSVITAAITSMISMGSVAASQMRRNSDFCSLFEKEFSPFTFRLSSTCRAVSPLSRSVFRRASVSSGHSINAFAMFLSSYRFLQSKRPRYSR